MRIVIFAVGGLCGALLSGCSTPSSTPAPKPPSLYATHADLIYTAYWKALVAEEKDNDRSRELINHSTLPESQAHLAVMRGEQAVRTEAQLVRPRAYIKDSIEGILKSRTWPEPPVFRIAQARGVIQVDGRGDEESWAAASPIPIAYPYAQTNAINRAPATCRLLWDQRNLYMLFEVADPNIVNTASNRDSSVSQGDCVEIFLLPSKRFGMYWELNISPAGVVYDALAAKAWNRFGGDVRPEEDAALTVAATVDGTLNRESDRDRGYGVEVALPWTELPGFQRGAVSGDSLFTLIGWADKAGLGKPGNPAYFSHTPVLAWFHNIWGYSRLILE
jgi:hypothetical protein